MQATLPANRPEVTAKDGVCLLQLTTLPEAIGAVGELLVERREQQALRDVGLTTLGDSNIVPVMIGDAARAVASAERVCEGGYWVKAVRPPTVPAGTSRLRLSLNAAMEWEQLAALPALIAASLG